MAKRKRKRHLRKHWQGKRKSEGERRRTEVRKKNRAAGGLDRQGNGMR